MASGNNETDQVQQPASRDEDLPLSEVRDPLHAYPYIEGLIYELPAPTLINWASLTDEIPDKHIKATSHHGNGNMYYLTTEGVFRRQSSAYATAIYNGEDLDKNKQEADQILYEVLEANDFTLESFHKLIEKPELNVVQLLQHTVRGFENMDPRVKVLLANNLLTARMRQQAQFALEEQTVITDIKPADEKMQKIGYSKRLQMKPYAGLINNITAPDVNPNSLKYIARLIGRYGMHLPLKTTMQFRPLTLEGFIRENCQKIAEGLEAGYDLLTESVKTSALVEEVVRTYPELGSGIPQLASVEINTFTNRPFPPGIEQALFNRSLIDFMQKQSNKLRSAAQTTPDLVQGSFIGQLSYPRRNHEMMEENGAL